MAYANKSFSSFTLVYQDAKNKIYRRKDPDHWGLSDQLRIDVEGRAAFLDIECDTTFQIDLAEDLRRSAYEDELLFAATLMYRVYPSAHNCQRLIAKYFNLHEFNDDASMFAYFTMDLENFSTK